jgi:hypothetical protein
MKDIISLLDTIQIITFFAKLFDIIHCSWYVVFSPFIIEVVIVVCAFIYFWLFDPHSWGYKI